MNKQFNNEEIIIPPVSEDSSLSSATKTFLAALNGSGGAPLKSLTPQEARDVLAGAQASVEVDYSGVEFSEKMIEADGFTIKLDIVRPEGSGDAILPVFIFIHGGGWVLGDFFNA